MKTFVKQNQETNMNLFSLKTRNLGEIVVVDRAAYNGDCMMTSSNGNIFRVTGHLCGEFTGHRWSPRWSPLTRASDAGLWFFFDRRLNKRLSKQSWGWWFETPSCPLWRQCNGTGNYQQDRPRCDQEYQFCHCGMHSVSYIYIPYLFVFLVFHHISKLRFAWFWSEMTKDFMLLCIEYFLYVNKITFSFQRSPKPSQMVMIVISRYTPPPPPWWRLNTLLDMGRRVDKTQLKKIAINIMANNCINIITTGFNTDWHTPGTTCIRLHKFGRHSM